MAKKSEPPKAKVRVDFRETFDRNFITHDEAVKNYLIKPSQLEKLEKHFRRSPYESEVSLVVYNRKDVEQLALQIYGSFENLEKLKKSIENKKKLTADLNYNVKRSLRDERRAMESVTPKKRRNEVFVVAIALLADAINFTFKLTVWFLTKSDSILAETIHSLADSLNQGILAVGLFQSKQAANPRHPYGYSNSMYVVSLISGVGIFCLGSAVSVFFGVLSLAQSKELEFISSELMWAFIVLAVSVGTDATCFCCSVISTMKAAKSSNLGFFYYTFRGVEPGVTVILLQDFAGVLGNVLAAAMLSASWYTNNTAYDASGSVLIGILLGAVALFLIVTNSTALVGRSISKSRLFAINKVLESDVMIRAIYDVKGIDIGNNLVRYKAEIDFDGAELTRLYLDHLNMSELLEEVKKINNVDDLENFLVTHGENIVDLVGGEIDRIELKVRGGQNSDHYPPKKKDKIQNTDALFQQ